MKDERRIEDGGSKVRVNDERSEGERSKVKGEWRVRGGSKVKVK